VAARAHQAAGAARLRSGPTLSKDDLIDAYPDRALVEGASLEGLIVSRSSGSSGKVLDVAYDATTYIAYVLATRRIYLMGFDYRPWHRNLYVYTAPYAIDSLFGLYPLHYVSTLAPIEELIDRLREVRPQLLVCYPSHARQLSDRLTGRDLAQIRSRLKLVSLNSEAVSQAELNHLEQIFGCPALDSYASEELARIAAQCRHKTYHVFEDMNYVEVLDDDGASTDDVGTIVGTNLHNFTMPLIRYVQNDLGQIEEAQECACGSQFRTVRDLEGRRNDTFVMPSGRKLWSGFLLDATYEFLLEHRTAVRDFCLVQEATDSVLLEIVRGLGWSEHVRSSIDRRMRSFFEPGVSFRIETVDQCEKTKTGKRNPIINRVGRPVPIG
jgi:phenylacetate-CoA ligase